MNKIQKGLACAVLGFSLAFSNGCTYPNRKLPDIPIREHQYYMNNDGVEIGVEPFDTVEECSYYLHYNVNAGGYLPFMVKVKNNKDKKIVFEPLETLVMTSQNTRLTSAKAEDMAYDFRYVVPAENIVIAYVMSPLGATIGTTSTQIFNNSLRKQYLEKVMSSSEVVNPGDEIKGLVLTKNYEKFTVTINKTNLYLYYNEGNETKEVVFQIGKTESCLKKDRNLRKK